MLIVNKKNNLHTKGGQAFAKGPIFVDKDKKNNTGFTLIEVLIALSVFTIGIVGGLAMALANYNDDQDNFNRVVGANLAREGVELIRNVRDNNWLKQDENADCSGNSCIWHSYLSDYDYIQIDYNDIEPIDLAGCNCTNDLNDCILYCDDQLYLDSSGYYNHDEAVFSTRFRRLIKMQGICMDGTGTETISNDNSCSAGDALVGFKVTSRVKWSEDLNDNEHIDVADYLYNWR